MNRSQTPTGRLISSNSYSSGRSKSPYENEVKESNIAKNRTKAPKSNTNITRKMSRSQSNLTINSDDKERPKSKQEKEYNQIKLERAESKSKLNREREKSPNQRGISRQNSQSKSQRADQARSKSPNEGRQIKRQESKVRKDSSNAQTKSTQEKKKKKEVTQRGTSPTRGTSPSRNIPTRTQSRDSTPEPLQKKEGFLSWLFRKTFRRGKKKAPPGPSRAPSPTRAQTPPLRASKDDEVEESSSSEGSGEGSSSSSQSKDDNAASNQINFSPHSSEYLMDNNVGILRLNSGAGFSWHPSGREAESFYDMNLQSDVNNPQFWAGPPHMNSAPVPPMPISSPPTFVPPYVHQSPSYDVYMTQHSHHMINSPPDMYHSPPNPFYDSHTYNRTPDLYSTTHHSIHRSYTDPIDLYANSYPNIVPRYDSLPPSPLGSFSTPIQSPNISAYRLTDREIEQREYDLAIRMSLESVQSRQSNRPSTPALTPDEVRIANVVPFNTPHQPQSQDRTIRRQLSSSMSVASADSIGGSTMRRGRPSEGHSIAQSVSREASSADTEIELAIMLSLEESARPSLSSQSQLADEDALQRAVIESIREEQQRRLVKTRSQRMEYLIQQFNTPPKISVLNPPSGNSPTGNSPTGKSPTETTTGRWIESERPKPQILRQSSYSAVERNTTPPVREARRSTPRSLSQYELHLQEKKQSEQSPKAPLSGLKSNSL